MQDYPKVNIQEVYVFKKALEKLIGQVKGFQKKPFYETKDARELLNKYIEQNGLKGNKN